VKTSKTVGGLVGSDVGGLFGGLVSDRNAMTWCAYQSRKAKGEMGYDRSIGAMVVLLIASWTRVYVPRLDPESQLHYQEQTAHLQ
jgi:hypothetical protein